MLTVKRTKDHVVIKLPVDTTDEQVEAIIAHYEGTRINELGLTPEQAAVVEELSASAKQGRWERVKAMFADHPQYDKLLRAAGEIA